MFVFTLAARAEIHFAPAPDSGSWAGMTKVRNPRRRAFIPLCGLWQASVILSEA